MSEHKITKNGGLIALFYGRRGHMWDLQRQLGHALDLDKAKANNADMSDRDRKIYLFRVDSRFNHDTTVIYLALDKNYASQSGEAQTTWVELRHLWQKKGFKSTLDEAMSEKDGEGQAAFWGYTLIYHAAIVEGQTLDQKSQENLLKLARRADLLEWKDPKPLAHTNVEDSDLWLMSVPNQWHGSEAATVYAALAPAHKEDDLINNILFPPNAALQQLDLIAHKAYYERRQFVSQATTSDPVIRKEYKKHIGELRDSISPFLGSTGKRKNFKTLKSKYEQLLLATSILDEPRLSLAQQLTNYEWWQKQLKMADIAEYHHRQIDITLKEVELLIDKGQRMLGATQTTIEMEQAELSQKRDERETLIAVLLGILGVALAVSQTIDASAAEALLLLFANLTDLPLTADNRLAQLLVQFSITLFVVLVMLSGYLWWRLKGPADL